MYNISSYHNYYNKYLKYKKKYLLLKNNKIYGGSLNETLIEIDKGIRILKTINPNQYYHQLQKRDGICQIRAANNFLGYNAYNSESILSYLSIIYNNFQKIYDIIVCINTHRKNSEDTAGKCINLSSNFLMLYDWIKTMKNIYDTPGMTDETKIISMFSNDEDGIYMLKDNNEEHNFLTHEIMFLLMFRLIDGELYFCPIGNLVNTTNEISLFEIYQTLFPDEKGQNPINVIHVGDTFRNHAYVFHIEEKQKYITKIDSLMSNFEESDADINIIQPKIKKTIAVVFNELTYTFYIKKEFIKITNVTQKYLEIYDTYFLSSLDFCKEYVDIYKDDGDPMDFD